MVIQTWLLLIMGLTFVIMIIYLHKQNTKRKSLPPGPWNLPVIGYLPWIGSKAPYLSLMKLSKTYGPIYGLNLGSIYTVVISDVDLLKKILFKKAGSGRAQLHVIDSLVNGKGLVFSEGDLWKNQRKLIHNFFREVGVSKTTQGRNKMETAITDNILELVEFIKSKEDQTVLTSAETLLHTVGSTISIITLGKVWSRDDEYWKYFLSILDDVWKLIRLSAPSSVLPFLRIFPIYKNIMRSLIKSREQLFTFCKKAIIEKCQTLHDDETISNLIQAFMIEKSKCQDATDIEKFYNEEQLLYLLVDMFASGIETTTNSMLWLLLYLAVYQEKQNKIQQELLVVLRGNLPTLEDLSKLPYTEATIAEVLRIRTMTPLGVPHEALEDITIDKFTIVKGAMIIPLIWAIHMDPKLWSDPEIFRPERFLNDEGKFYQPESFIPFQMGKRMCVGMELAKMQLFLFVSIMFQKFRIKCEDPHQIDLTGTCGLFLSPKAYKLTFSEINI